LLHQELHCNTFRPTAWRATCEGFFFSPSKTRFIPGLFPDYSWIIPGSKEKSIVMTFRIRNIEIAFMSRDTYHYGLGLSLGRLGGYGLIFCKTLCSRA
jgi:hypothetical protein